MTKGTHAPKITNALKKRIEFLLVHEGISQTKAAEIIGLNRKTIGIWNKKHKWSDKQKKKSDLVKFDDSLNAFIAWNNIKHPERKEQLNDWYNSFKNSI